MLDRRTFTIGAGALALTAGAAWAQNSDEMFTLGAANAPLHLVEYASATCPHCAHFHETNWARLKSGYIDTGRVRYTLREMVTPPPPVAVAMFQVARCNGADAAEYYRRLGILFERQRAILSSGSMAGVRDALFAVGAEWGLSNEQIWASITDQAGAARVGRSIQEASARGVNSTPTFYLNDQHLADPTFLTPDGMAAILDAAG
ncbi:thioredoxin domain-containing protein [Vitreimonas flagellata]|uniref:thioredoxin domain-containing protein n=1 Tax=Vitreimonas flagellata TaxID=2560861 RepID=UPI001074D9AF|nr:thioredoxin domain-containing protein [Vitreimonas flagellata]